MGETLIQSSEALALILYYGISALVFMISMKMTIRVYNDIQRVVDKSDIKFIIIKTIFIFEVVYCTFLTFAALFSTITGVPIIFANSYVILKSQNPLISLVVIGGSIVTSVLLNLEYIKFAKNELFNKKD